MSQNASAKLLTISTLTNRSVIADQCKVAESFFERLRGLIGFEGLSEGQGVLFPRNNSIHMWFMSFPIDVLFVRRRERKDGGNFEVVSVRENLRPWKVLPVGDLRASDTIELKAGTVQRFGIQPGDGLCIS